MFGNFVWWQGVVEDRIDPLKLGRCRVRILGYHTDNKQEGVGIPTSHLPWATPSQPVTSAAMNGIGTTPMGPVEGTWVFGFFRDGENAQEPVITGTFGGVPQKVADASKGFNDPKGAYPLKTFLKEPDTNRLARGGGGLPVALKDAVVPPGPEDHPSLDLKRKSRSKNVATAYARDLTASIPKTSNTSLYGVLGSDGTTTESPANWNEPNPRYGGVDDSDTKYLDSVKKSSMYPYNHVKMSESGHVEEWDDTKTAERLHRYHRSGTFEEIQPDGTRVVKIRGNDYEITAGYKNVEIKGTCNVTIGGDCRMLYLGDLVQEVRGDYHLYVQGDMRTKIKGNDVKEIHADRKITVGSIAGTGNDDLTVVSQQTIDIGSHKTTTVKGQVKDVFSAADSSTAPAYITIVEQGSAIWSIKKNTTISCTANIDVGAVGKLGLGSGGDCNISIAGGYKQKVTGSTTKHYLGAFHERWDGDKWTHTGANTFSRHESGVDHACSSDPSRTSANSCTAVNTVS